MKPIEPTQKDGQTKRSLLKRTKLLVVAEEDNLKLCPDLRPDIELKVTAAVDLLVHRSKVVVVEERDLMTHQ